MPSLRIFLDRLLEGAAAKVPRLDLTHVERLALVRQHGDFSLAYSTAVQKLSYFGDTEGYIAFGTKMKHHFALGDPVAHPPDRPDYIRRFVEAADSPWFVQIGEPTARVLSGLGYQVNRLGVDTRLELPAHDFSGKRNETVRYSERWLLKKGFSFGEGAVYLDEVQRLSQNWRADRIVKRWEMGFLNRPFADHLERNLLQVENDVSRIFGHTGNRAELMRDALNPNCGNGGAFNGAQKHAAQAGANGGSKSTLERLSREHAIAIGKRLGISHKALWFLETFKHRCLLSARLTSNTARR